MIKAYLSANIPLYKQNKKYIKNLFHDVGHRRPSETICRKTVLQVNADGLQRIRNAVHEKQIFLVVDESTQYLNILIESPDHLSTFTMCAK